MPIITLTTDLGESDYYTGSLKGYIMSNAPDAKIIDITHQIKPFDILHAAFVLKNIVEDYPAGTIHIVSVSTEQNINNRFLLIRYQQQYILGIDNGLFSIALSPPPESAVNLPILKSMKLSFPGRDILAYYACQIANGKSTESIGPGIKQMKKLNLLVPVVSGNSIKGHIIYIDHYENIMVNITKDLFEKERNGRPFSILIGRTEYISHISSYYDEVPTGEKLALFNSTAYLEIAINKGNAAGLLGLNKGDAIIINFEG